MAKRTPWGGHLEGRCALQSGTHGRRARQPRATFEHGTAEKWCSLGRSTHPPTCAPTPPMKAAPRLWGQALAHRSRVPGLLEGLPLLVLLQNRPPPPPPPLRCPPPVPPHTLCGPVSATARHKRGRGTLCSEGRPSCHGALGQGGQQTSWISSHTVLRALCNGAGGVQQPPTSPSLSRSARTQGVPPPPLGPCPVWRAQGRSQHLPARGLRGDQHGASIQARVIRIRRTLSYRTAPSWPWLSMDRWGEDGPPTTAGDGLAHWMVQSTALGLNRWRLPSNRQRLLVHRQQLAVCCLFFVWNG